MIWPNWLVRLFTNGGVGSDSVAIKNTNNNTATRDYKNPLVVDRSKARRIYHNSDKNYALAAHFVKPIINNNINFIGEPILKGNKKTITVLEDIGLPYKQIHKGMEIEGTIAAWPQWDIKTNKVKIVLIPLDVIKEVFIDPLTKEITGYRLEETVSYATATSSYQYTSIVHVITADVVMTKMTGSINKVIKNVNPFGVVPIVLFTNDKDFDEMYGHSEIENIEPQLKFYHDLTFEAGAAQSRDGHPKLKVSSADPKQWVNNNFGSGAWDRIASGQDTLNIDDRDLYINQGDDDVNYIYLNKTSGDYMQLSETTFTNIVEGSETPEINFGANIGTSLASVKEQRPVWIKKIEAKQAERGEQWATLVDVILIVYNFVNFRNLKNDIEFIWPKPNFISAAEQATIIESLAKALEKLKSNGILTNEEIFSTLKEFDLFELMESYEKHEEVIDDKVASRKEKTETGNDSTEEESDEEPDETDEDNN